MISSTVCVSSSSESIYMLDTSIKCTDLLLLSLPKNSVAYFLYYYCSLSRFFINFIKMGLLFLSVTFAWKWNPIYFRVARFKDEFITASYELLPL